MPQAVGGALRVYRQTRGAASFSLGESVAAIGMHGRSATSEQAIVALAAMLVSLLLPLSMLYSNPYDNTGVVTVETVRVLGGPGPQYAKEFTLHSGARVRLVDSWQGWLRISLPGGELQG